MSIFARLSLGLTLSLATSFVPAAAFADNLTFTLECLAALKAGDTNVALAIMAPDVMIFEEGGAERSRDEYASHHLGSDAAFAAASEATVTRRSGWADGDIAWITSEGRTTGQFNGRAVDRLTTETMVLKRHADGWRIHHIHWSSRAPG